MKKYKIIAISHSFTEIKKLDSNLTYKLFEELDKYFDLNVLLYSYQEDFKKIFLPCNYLLTLLPFKKKNRISKFLNLIYIYYKNINTLKIEKYDLVWLGITSQSYLLFSFIYPLLFDKKYFFVQLFTPSVNTIKYIRKILDYATTILLSFFENIAAGNQRNIDIYKIPKEKLVDIKIGMPDYGFVNRSFSNLKLVYLGTLNSREIDKSVYGLYLFKEKYQHISITYDIIGSGNKNEIQKIMDLVEKYKMNSYVKYHGFVESNKLKELLFNFNIGISYVPINDYYQNASTKTLEYLLMGMPVIATKNEFRSSIITADNGILCEDNPESFCNAIYEVWLNLSKYDSAYIRNKFVHYSLQENIRLDYVPQLINIITKNKKNQHEIEV